MGCIGVYLPFTVGFALTLTEGLKVGLIVGAASDSRALSASTRKNTVMIMFLPVCKERVNDMMNRCRTKVRRLETLQISL